MRFSKLKTQLQKIMVIALLIAFCLRVGTFAQRNIPVFHGSGRLSSAVDYSKTSGVFHSGKSHPSPSFSLGKRKIPRDESNHLNTMTSPLPIFLPYSGCFVRLLFFPHSPLLSGDSSVLTPPPSLHFLS